MTEGGWVIYPSLGACASWHMVEGAPMGSPEGAATALISMADKFGGLPAQNWPIQPQLIKGMAVELAVAAGIEGRALSGDLIRLLAWAAGLNGDFIQDTPAFFAGSWKGGRPRGDEGGWALASGLDRHHYQAAGRVMPLATLRDSLVAQLGETEAPSRSTLKRWRNEPDYHDFVRFTDESKT